MSSPLPSPHVYHTSTHTHLTPHILPHTTHTHLLPTGISLPALEAEENLSDYKFPKFAAIYFQGAATHAFISQPMKQPLLALKNEQDKLVRCSYAMNCRVHVYD